MADEFFDIADMPQIASASGGFHIMFDFVDEIGVKQTFRLKHEHVGSVVMGLMRAGGMAAAERAKLPSDQIRDAGRVVALPLDVPKLVVGIGTDGQIALIATTSFGFEVTFRLPRDVAEQLSEGLPGVLQKAPTAPPSNRQKN